MQGFKYYEQLARAVSILVQRTELEEADAATVAIFFPNWSKDKEYSNKEWVRWGEDEAGNPLLYAATKTIKAGGGAPDVTPGSYRLLGR